MNHAQYRAIEKHVGQRVGYGHRDYEDFVQEAAIAETQGRHWDWGINDHYRHTYRWIGHSRRHARYFTIVSGDEHVSQDSDGNSVNRIDTIADPTVNIEEHSTRGRAREILEPLTRRQQTIALMLANDTPGHVIAEHLGIHESRISQIIHDIQRRITNGPPASHHHPVAPADRRAHVVKRRREGAGYKQIADELAVTEHAIKHHVRNARRDGTLP